jgi:hypothetical protein
MYTPDLRTGAVNWLAKLAENMRSRSVYEIRKKPDPMAEFKELDESYYQKFNRKPYRR